MRKSALFITAGLLLALAGPASATCLRLQDMKDAQAPDGKTLIVTMNNGKVWHNRLVGSCSELKWQGFAWTTHSDDVCDREQSLRVLNSGQICQLGVFEPGPAPKKTVAPPQ